MKNINQLTKARVFLDNAKHNFDLYFKLKDSSYLSVCCFDLYNSLCFYLCSVINLVDQDVIYNGKYKPDFLLTILNNSNIPKGILNSVIDYFNKLVNNSNRQHWGGRAIYDNRKYVSSEIVEESIILFDELDSIIKDKIVSF